MSLSSPSVKVRRSTISNPPTNTNTSNLNPLSASVGTTRRSRATTLSRLYDLEEGGGLGNLPTRGRRGSLRSGSERGHHEDDEVDLLDVLDDSISTTSHLTNIQSAFFPNSWVSAPICDLNTSPSPPSPPAELAEGGAAVEEEDELDQHLRKLLRNQKRKDKLTLILSGLLTFLKTPLGWLVALYTFLVIFWGAGLVFILIIPFQNSYTKAYWVEISSQILTALFTITGIGLIPMRVRDTYYISVIYSFLRRTREKRVEAGLEVLKDKNDLVSGEGILTVKEEERLEVARGKFGSSQRWYRAHASLTHYAYPIRTALIITLLVDINSLFQALLCGVMWGYAYPANNWLNRPPELTAIFIVCSFGAGLGAAILIGVGGERTKKKKEVSRKVWEMLKREEEELELKKGEGEKGEKGSEV